MKLHRASLALALGVFLVGAVQSQESSTPGPNRPHPRGDFFHSMSPDQQGKFLKLLDEWSKLPPNQRTELLDRFAQSKNFTPEQRDALRRSLERFEKMPTEQRDRIRERMHKWQTMSPEERERFHKREQEMREKTDRDLKQKLDTLGVQPGPDQMRWIRQFYFRKRMEIERQAMQRARELKSQLPPEASDEEKQKVRQKVREYRKELEEKAEPEFAEFVRNPHALSPPQDLGSEKPIRKHAPRRQGGPQAQSPGESH